MINRAAAKRSHPAAVLAILLLISTFSFADRFLITGLVGPIRKTFAIGDGAIGLLMGPAFVVLYVVLGVPLARLADRGMRVRIIAGGCVLWSVATVMTGLASAVWTFALARVAVGVGEAAFAAPAYSLLVDYFRPERRSMAFAVLGLATYFGQIGGQAGGPALDAFFGNWHLAFVVMGAPGILLGILALTAICEPTRAVAIGQSLVASIPLLDLVKLLVATPAFLLVLGGFLLSALSGIAFAYWAPELLSRTLGLDQVTVKSAFALNFGLSGLIGMLGFGLVSDWLSRRGMQWPARLSAVSILFATAAIVGVVWSGSFRLAMALALPAGLLGGGWSVGLLSTLQYLLPDRFRASATALFFAMTTLGGYLVAPWITGWLSEVMGNDALSLRIALTIVIPLGFVGALLSWLASTQIEPGRERLAKI